MTMELQLRNLFLTRISRDERDIVMGITKTQKIFCVEPIYLISFTYKCTEATEINNDAIGKANARL